MQVLWAPWRMAYIEGPKADGPCLFCTAATGDARDRLVLGVTTSTVVMLNRYPYQTGHLMVAPRRHTASLSDLPADEYQDLSETLRHAQRTLGEVLHAEGFNLGMNLGACAGAGIKDHLHWHIVPRWNGDTNFMPIVADTKVIVQSLESLYDLLRERLSKSAGVR